MNNPLRESDRPPPYSSTSLGMEVEEIGCTERQPTDTKQQMANYSRLNPSTTDDNWLTGRQYPLKTWVWFDGSRE